MDLSLDIDEPVQKPGRQPGRQKEPGEKTSSGRTVFRILLLTVLLILAAVSVIARFLPDAGVDESVTTVEHMVISETPESKRIRVNGCEIEYSTALWTETASGLEAVVNNGYYRIAFRQDNLYGVTLAETVNAAAAVLKDQTGIDMGGTADKSTEDKKHYELTYSRKEINVNNIVTGNAEYTREIYIQPEDSQNYTHIIITKYIAEGIDYTVLDEDAEKIIGSLQ